MASSSASTFASTSNSASPSSSTSTDIPPKEKYDVFLSFRGPDTRRTFISHLKKALDDKKIDTYIDYGLERGEEIGSALLEAIERSMISVVVFSENYASSRWCLDELVHILKCKVKNKQHVIPIFYDTDVSDIRHQRKSYELEECLKDRTETERFNWKVALTTAANLSGFESSSFRDDSELVQQVVQFIVGKLDYKSFNYEIRTRGLVGVESRVQKIESLLCIVPQDDRVRSLVIWGMGGIGKTTLANAVFQHLSPQFEACCFLGDVREGSGTQKEQKALRDKLLRDLFGCDTLNIQSTINGSIAKRLSGKRVLVVLDDVDKSSQLEMLAGPDVTFGSGSRIIITTRYKQRASDMEVLWRGGNHEVMNYEVEKLNNDEARQLFNLKASTGISSGVDSTNLSRMINHAAGNPLALKHWSSLSRILSWDQMTQSLNEEMGSIYRVSYKALRKNAREVFLDIACFHKWGRINDVRGRLESHGLFADSGIEDLIGSSLIEVRDNCIWMHDEIREMGRKIVEEECPEEPGKRSRLYIKEDICHVLQNDTGSETLVKIKVECDMEFWSLNSLPIYLTPQVFGKMYNLTFLQLDGLECILPAQGLESLPPALRYLYWKSYPLKTLPPNFSPRFLVELHMPNSQLETVWNEYQNPRHLKHIDLSQSRALVDVPYLTESLESINLQNCKSLDRVPNLSKSLNIVRINLIGCEKLVEVPSYFKNLHMLTDLNLRGCLLLKCIPEMPSNMERLLIGERPMLLPDSRTDGGMELSGLPSSIWSLTKLVELDLSGCSHIKNLPISGIWMLKSLTSLDLSYMSLKDLPSSIKGLSCIVSIDLRHCYRLASLPASIGELKSLEKLDLSCCCKLVRLPKSVGELRSLKILNLYSCSSFVSLPNSITKLNFLEKLDLSGCSSFKFFPKISKTMESLKTLRLSGTKIKELHKSIEKASSLEELDISWCKSLETVSNSIYKLRFLKDFRGELKQMPISSSEILWSSLSRLDLSGCPSLEEISDGLMICLTSLEELNLNDSKIKNIASSIKELSGLRRLYVRNCDQLKSLPELPSHLNFLNADGCKNLETVSFSSTAVIQGLDQIRDARTLACQEKYSFCGCKKLSETAKKNMMDDAQLRIVRMGTAFSQWVYIYPDFSRTGYSYQKDDYSVAIVYPGNEMPEWFKYRSDSNEGSSIHVELPVHPSHTKTNFWQLVLCAILTYEDKDIPPSKKDSFFTPCCISNFKNKKGDCSQFDFKIPSSYEYKLVDSVDKSQSWFDDKSQVFVWYCAQWSVPVRDNSHASFDFMLYRRWLAHTVSNRVKVKMWGVCMLPSQSQDVE